MQPEVFTVRYRDGKRPPYPYNLGDLMLAIEIASPSNPVYDYHVKRTLYLSNGVPEYPIVNTDARMLSRWRSLEELSREITWHPDGMPAALTIDLPALFEDALG